MSHSWKPLAEKMPDAAWPLVEPWLSQHKLQVVIARKRKTKLGDYSPPYGSRMYHRISVNGDLSKEAFLVTFIHEWAHLLTWVKHQRAVAPHGEEWQQCYRKIMAPFLQPSIFPDSLLRTLAAHLKSPSATSCADPELMKALQPRADHLMYVYEVPVNGKFQLPNGRTFEHVGKKRTRHLCRDIRSGQLYLVHGMAEVMPAG